jgi:hypothetical protein
MSRGRDQDFLDRLADRIQAREPSPEKAKRNGHAKNSPDTVSGLFPTDEQVIEKCRNKKDAAEFSRLFEHADMFAQDNNASSADFALLRHLKFYTQDPDQLDRLMRLSALRRPKWDENRAGRTWLRYSIDNALTDPGEVYDWPMEVGRPSSNDGNVSLSHTQMGFGANKPEDDKPLPIKTVEEVIEEAGATVPWVIEDLLARGAVTEFSGKAKDSGKTTFWCHAIAAGARGETHAGFFTTPARYLYLTEQGNNFALALRDSGLTEQSHHVRIVQFKDVTALQWDRLVRRAAKDADHLGMDALVVDTFAVFARLGGSEENDSGPVADRMRVLREVAQKYDSAVLLIRHAGKDGTPRGSSAFEAEADICITLGKPEGRHAPTVRTLSGKGRYGVWERNLQLHEGRYISLGTDAKVEFNRAVRFLRAVLPREESSGMRRQAILDKRVGADAEQITASTLDRALTWLVSKGAVLKTKLEGEQGQPVVYWLNPDEEGHQVSLSQTPSPNGANKEKRPVTYNLVSSSPEHPRGSDSDDTSKTTVAGLFANPPDWLVTQLKVYRKDPGRHFEPLCSAVAAVVLEDGARAPEVKGEVEKALEEGTQSS